MRMVQEAENLGDLFSYIFKIVPSFAISDSLLWSFNREDLNKTRNYTEADFWLSEYRNMTLAQRTNITLEPWELANMGGNLVSLGVNAIVFGTLLVLIESGILACRCRRQQRAKVSDSSDDNEN